MTPVDIDVSKLPKARRDVCVSAPAGGQGRVCSAPCLAGKVRPVTPTFSLEWLDLSPFGAKVRVRKLSSWRTKFLRTSKAGMLLRINRLDSDGHLTHQDSGSRLRALAEWALRPLKTDAGQGSLLRTKLECPLESTDRSSRALSQEPGNVAGTPWLRVGRIAA